MIKIPPFQSQAGQDAFVFELLVHPRGAGARTNGTFLDIGANHPKEWSNTWALEQIGWKGVLVEREPYAAGLLRNQRTSKVMQDDATLIDWSKLPEFFDYLSLDVDYISHKVLLDILVAGMKFALITLEHNEWNYPVKGSPRLAGRGLLQAHGYELICGNVRSNGQPFEDWWVDPKLVDRELAHKFRCDGMEGLEIVNAFK